MLAGSFEIKSPEDADVEVSVRPTNRPPTRLSQGDQILRDAAELADAARRTYQAKPSLGAVWLGSRIRGAKSSCAMLRR